MRSRVRYVDTGCMANIGRVLRVLSALRQDHQQAATEYLPREQRATLQRDRLEALVRHAIANSPFYAAWYREHRVSPATPIADLPPLDKATLMANWGDFPVDRSLTLEAARAALQRDGQVRGHHIFQTGGSTGEPAVFAYDATGIDQLLANFVRSPRFNGVRPRLPRRVAMSVVWAPGTIHMAARLSGLMDVGLYRMQRLPASAPISDLAERLSAHQPDILGGYAGTLGLLAAAQLDGELDIAPRAVIPGSEPLTDPIRARIRAAWGVEPFDVYATTETGPLAQECSAHRGLHVYEDTTIIRPADGHILVTNLFNNAFPLINFVIDDLIKIDPEPCTCGRTSARITNIAGRANDILELPSASESTPVSVHPSAWTPLTALNSVADAEIVMSDRTLTIRAVPRGDRAEMLADVQSYVARTLAELGVGPVNIRFEAAESLPRTGVGKRLLVRRV